MFDHPLYHAAIAADKALSDALTLLYGDGAGDMRYRAPQSTHIASLMLAKLEADRAWLCKPLPVVTSTKG